MFKKFVHFDLSLPAAIWPEFFHATEDQPMLFKATVQTYQEKSGHFDVRAEFALPSFEARERPWLIRKLSAWSSGRLIKQEGGTAHKVRPAE